MFTLFTSFIFLASQILPLYCYSNERTNEEIVPFCNNYFGSPVNQCSTHQTHSEVKLSVAYYCIDENTIEERYFIGQNCDESAPFGTVQSECTDSNGCYCGSQNECDVVEISVTSCNDSRPVQMLRFVADACVDLDDSVGGYHVIHCSDDGQVSFRMYNDSTGCAGGFNEIFFSDSCENPTFGDAVSCVVDKVVTEEPTTTLASRLCLMENELDEYNKCGIFQFNGGCQQHFEQDALIFEDKSGKMSYTECCAKCNEMNECKSFSFGKKGGNKANRCNIYSLECIDDVDCDWYMFTPINNANNICNLMQ